jgi:hypothetical protein
MGFVDDPDAMNAKLAEMRCMMGQPVKKRSATYSNVGALLRSRG